MVRVTISTWPIICNVLCIFQWLELLFPAWPIICNVLCLYFACCASPVFYLQYPVLLSATITIMIAKPVLEIMASIMTVCGYKCYATVLIFVIQITLYINYQLIILRLICKESLKG